MEMINACLCCMLRPPDKDLSTPYPRLGSTEIYSDMLEYCFQIQLTAGSEEGGICEDCVGQLRDARDFRLQVECSQARLQAQMRPWLPLEDKAAGCLPVTWAVDCLPETCPEEANDETQPNEQSPVIIEIDTDSEDESYGEASPPATPASDTADAADDTADAGDDTADAAHETADAVDDTADAAGLSARQQLAMTCRVRLVRLRPAPGSAAAEPRPPTRRHSDQHQDKPYFCYLCNKQFTEISDLVAHMDTHTGQKPYSCQVCYKSFAIKSHLMLHKKKHSINYNQIATADKCYQCKICKKEYTNRKCLTDHMRWLHKKRKIDSCDVCGKLCRSKSHLIEHERVHTGERPFRCEECNKLFKVRRYLDIHMRVHTGIKPYGCDICKRQFAQKCNLLRHTRKHAVQKPYTGEVCNIKFAHSSHVTRPKMTGTGFKLKYFCQKCKMQFVKKSELIKHKRTHTV